MNIINKNINKRGVLGIKPFMFLCLFVVFFEFYFVPFAPDKSLTDWYLLQLSLIFVVSYADIVMKLGWLHLFSLLQFSTFVFMISSPILSPLTGGASIRFAYTPAPTYFSEQVIQHVFLIFSAYLAATHLFFFFLNHNAVELKPAPKTNWNFYKIGRTTIIVMFPFALIYSLFLLGTDRTESYAVGTSGLGMPIYLRLTNYIYKVGFAIFIASCPPYKKFIKYNFIFFLSLIPMVLYGERGDTFMVIMFVVWYICRFYNKKIKFVYIVVGALAGVLASYAMMIIRAGSILEHTSFSQMITLFFQSSSTTCELTSFFVLYGEKVPHQFPFFLDQGISGIWGLFSNSGAGQNELMLNTRSSLGHNLVYYISPQYYLGGNSTGTAWITEWYEFGLLGVVIGAFILSWTVRFLNARLMYCKYVSIFTYMLFSFVILSPRGSLFLPILEVIKYFIVFFILQIIFRFFKITNKY